MLPTSCQQFSVLLRPNNGSSSGLRLDALLDGADRVTSNVQQTLLSMNAKLEHLRHVDHFSFTISKFFLHPSLNSIKSK